MHLGSLDILRGLCALGVILIHSRAILGHPFATYLVDRAAPVFVVLMGVTATLWWQAHGDASLGDWYRSRLRRLYPPMWSMLAVWWLLVALLAPRYAVPFSASVVAQQIAGNLIGVGTGWFVTMAIALAAAVPLLRALERHLGAGALLLLGLVSTAVSFHFIGTILRWGGYAAWLPFPPRLLAHFTFGMWLAHRMHRLGWREAGLAAAILVAYLAAPTWLAPWCPWRLVPPEPLKMRTVDWLAYRLCDLPTTVLLLVACGSVGRAAWLLRPLAWLGRESYAAYLGQMLGFNALLFSFGLVAVYDSVGRWRLAALLLVASVAWIVATQATRRLRAAVAARRATGS